MNTENVVLMRMARESLKDRWGLAIGAYLLYLVVAVALQMVPFAGAIAGLIIAGPLAVGMATFAIRIARNEEARIEQMFEGFNNFGTALAAYLLMLVFILLWTLLLIIPGIIAALSYSMTFYILADDPTTDPMHAIDQSKAMMDGHKWKLFCLMLRFLGWGLLCILTLGIGLLWLVPWMYVTMAKFYDDVKADAVVPVSV